MAKRPPRKCRQGADAMGGLGELVSNFFGELSTPLKSAAKTLAKEAIAAGMYTSAIAGLRAGRGMLCPALRLMVKVPDALDYATRSMVEAENEDWTIMSEAVKDTWRRRAVYSIRGLERWLLLGEGWPDGGEDG